MTNRIGWMGLAIVLLVMSCSTPDPVDLGSNLELIHIDYGWHVINSKIQRTFIVPGPGRENFTVHALARIPGSKAFVGSCRRLIDPGRRFYFFVNNWGTVAEFPTRGELVEWVEKRGLTVPEDAQFQTARNILRRGKL